MTDNEVNKIIAEFMDKRHGQAVGQLRECPVCEFKPYQLYTESLDALVPAWVKMSVEKGDGVWINFARHGVEDYHLAFFRHRDNSFDYGDCVDVTPQKVAAHATAKAILELRNK